MKRGDRLRHLFIVNPAAGKRRLARLTARLEALPFAHEVVLTRAPGDARRLARQAAETGQGVRIYACGGDGTLNEVVNGAAGYPNAAVTNVPTGTGNDFLKLFGRDWRALFSDPEALARGPEAEFDLIDCGGMLGIDIVCVGVDARIAAGVDKYKRLPFVSGMGAYVLSLIETVLFRGISRPIDVTLGDGEAVYRGEMSLCCVCSGRYYGGGFCPVPEAMPDDGVLDMLYVPRVGLWTLARLVGRYARGRYRQMPEYIFPYRGQTARFTAQEPFVAVVDGEVLRGDDFTVRLSEKKIRFFYPAGADYRPRV